MIEFWSSKNVTTSLEEEDLHVFSLVPEEYKIHCSDTVRIKGSGVICIPTSGKWLLRFGLTLNIEHHVGIAEPVVTRFVSGTPDVTTEMVLQKLSQKGRNIEWKGHFNETLDLKQDDITYYEVTYHGKIRNFNEVTFYGSYTLQEAVTKKRKAKQNQPGNGSPSLGAKSPTSGDPAI